MFCSQLLTYAFVTLSSYPTAGADAISPLFSDLLSCIHYPFVSSVCHLLSLKHHLTRAQREG